MTPTKGKLKTYSKARAIASAIILIWLIYMTIKGYSYYWILAIIFGMLLVYWSWKVFREWKLGGNEV